GQLCPAGRRRCRFPGRGFGRLAVSGRPGGGSPRLQPGDRGNAPAKGLIPGRCAGGANLIASAPPDAKTLQLRTFPMKIDGNAIRPGMVIEHQGRLWRATKIAHTQPGKGGAYLQVELRDLRDGTKLNERFRSSEKVERATLEQKDYQFLFAND